MRITHVDSETTWRGGQQSLLTLARGLRALGHQQTIVCPSHSPLARRAAAEGFPVADSITRDVHIVHSHSGKAQNQAYRATIRSKVRRIVTRHVAFEPRLMLVHRIKYNYTCDAIIAVSDAVRSRLIADGIHADRIHVIRTGIELPASLPTIEQRSAARRRFGLDDHAFVVGHIGAFTEEKGQRTAIAASRVLQSSLPHAQFLLAGSGPLLAELRGESGANVLFPGFIRDVAMFYAALDLFLMPSRSEAWGLAAVEAMAYGIPVIASNVGGLPELVQDGISGWLLPADDAVAWTEKIASLAANTSLRETISAVGLLRAKEFSVANMAEQTVKLYRGLL